MKAPAHYSEYRAGYIKGTKSYFQPIPPNPEYMGI